MTAKIITLLNHDLKSYSLLSSKSSLIAHTNEKGANITVAPIKVSMSIARSILIENGVSGRARTCD